MRCTILALVALIACQGRKPEPPPPPPKDGVTLIQPGAAPASTLRYHPTRGIKTVEQDGTKVEVTDPHNHAEAQGTLDLARYAFDVASTSTFTTTMNVVAPQGTPGDGASTVEVTMAIQLRPPVDPPVDPPAAPVDPAPGDPRATRTAPTAPAAAGPRRAHAAPGDARRSAAAPASGSTPSTHGAHKAP